MTNLPRVTVLEIGMGEKEISLSARRQLRFNQVPTSNSTMHGRSMPSARMGETGYSYSACHQTQELYLSTRPPWQALPSPKPLETSFPQNMEPFTRPYIDRFAQSRRRKGTNSLLLLPVKPHVIRDFWLIWFGTSCMSSDFLDFLSIGMLTCSQNFDFTILPS